ncbi:hypothetical protein BC938DRAFT_477344, partial [Jimgerdemannia flammicorona]
VNCACESSLPKPALQPSTAASGLFPVVIDILMPLFSSTCFGKWSGIVPAAIIVVLTAFTYFVYVARLCVTLTKLGAMIQAIIYLVLYHIILIMLLLSYIRVFVRKPGGINKASLTAHLTTPTTSLTFADTQNAAISSISPPLDIDTPNSDTPNSAISIPLAISISSAPDPTRSPILDSAPQLPNEAVVDYHPITATRDGGLRWCIVCQVVKPDRTHHCHICGECVLKMDQ